MGLEPADARFARNDVRVMLGTQANAGPQRRGRCGWRRQTRAHVGAPGESYLPGVRLPPTSRAQAAASGLDLPNVEFRGLVPARVLRERCQKEADFLYVPMKFGEDASVNARISFPSKLADYTEMGLPLLIRGPEYCSAVQWARKNPGVAEVVESVDRASLQAAVDRLIENATYRQQLAARALEVGRTYFSHGAAQATFHRSLNFPGTDI